MEKERKGAGIVRPKLTPRLIVRTVGFLALFLWGAYNIFRVPGGTLLMRAAVGFVLAVLCLETLLPLLRALPAVTERMDFPLAGLQYLGVPVVGLLVLAVAVCGLALAGELDTRSLIKAGTTGVALCAMMAAFVRTSWRRYRAERSKSRKERLAELDRAYERKAIGWEEYQSRREAIYESMWRVER